MYSFEVPTVRAKGCFEQTQKQQLFWIFGITKMPYSKRGVQYWVTLKDVVKCGISTSLGEVFPVIPTSPRMISLDMAHFVKITIAWSDLVGNI